MPIYCTAPTLRYPKPSTRWASETWLQHTALPFPSPLLILFRSHDLTRKLRERSPPLRIPNSPAHNTRQGNIPPNCRLQHSPLFCPAGACHQGVIRITIRLIAVKAPRRLQSPYSKQIR
ncbi:hypothetical protein M0802_017024 [Mischocyttarus mexicanus]|nr:hypothetical protein M0802_017024 [Mischocyttarus mexicanus]